ncbi:acyl--CoA ligase [Nocardia sp. NBC_00565]|uniref:class I adenylate-forming enzyme family protein n=1 Tax=Nocardia sp. NBC_00565 TaxID=2975993 RepID=UPI002E80135B|nr:class I adenylate-forming enzyme family protein [Nocardia sp. NBC_00565]WUC05690.1 acyl--CoA ligase [Nocardia sp. NBC_00565]
MTAIRVSAPLRAGAYANTAELLEAAATAHGSRDAYVEADGTRISFADWIARAHAVAAQLTSVGVGTGDVVALMLPSCIDYAVCYAAAAMLGAITTGLNPRLGPREIAAVLDQAAPVLVIRDTGNDQLPPVPAGLTELARSDLATGRADADSLSAQTIQRKFPVSIVFTSGTTGLPKGAWFDADNLAASAAAAGVMSAPYDRRLTSTPFAHVGYMSKLWDQLVWGTTIVISPAPWTAAGMFDVLRAERITVAGAVPTQWAKLLDLPGVTPEALPCLRIGVVATAPASPALVAQTAERLGVALVVRYAMTESPTICGTEPDDPPEVQYRTVGRPQAGVDVRITDDTGLSVPTGEVGRVRIKGGCVMRGYWQNQPLTDSAFDAEGYLVSGDLGKFDTDGNLVLVGRSGDMYIRGGFNIHPVEVEQVLAEHPRVRNAAVVGHPADVIGEIGVAFVVPDDPADPISLPALRDWAKAHLSDYKAPDHLIVLDELPLTAMSKIDRNRLRHLAADNPPPPRKAQS